MSSPEELKKIVNGAWDSINGVEKPQNKGGRPTTFDVKGYLGRPLRKKKIVDALIKQIEQGRNTKSIEVALKVLGELVEKREDTVKVEFTPADYTRIARQTVERLIAEYRECGGSCPLCGRREVLREAVCLDTESEHEEGGEVGSVALST